MRRGLLAVLLVTGGAAHGAGGTALDAYNFVTGARSAGMGGAVTAVVADPTALQWNPAGLGRITSYAASLSHLMWVADISYSYLGGAVPVPVGFLGLPVNATAGVSLQMLDYGPIESTRGLAESADASDFGVTLGGGVRFFDRGAAGFGVKYFRHALDDAAVGEAALDIGALYEVWPERMAIAAVCQNVGYAESLGGHRPPMPMTFKIGGAVGSGEIDMPVYAHGNIPFVVIRSRTVVSVDFTAQKGEPGDYSFGLESGLNDVLFLRGGYLRPLQYTGGGFPGWSGGLGLKLRFLGSALALDYAYGSVGELGSAQYMTLSWSPVPAKKGRAPAALPAPAPAVVDVAAEYRAGSELYAARQYGPAESRAAAVVRADPGHWAGWQLLGNCRYAGGDLSGAIAAYEASLRINPDNPSLAVWLQQLKQR